MSSAAAILPLQAGTQAGDDLALPIYDLYRLCSFIFARLYGLGRVFRRCRWPG
jgi:hypothetical protein